MDNCINVPFAFALVIIKPAFQQLLFTNTLLCVMTIYSIIIFFNTMVQGANSETAKITNGRKDMGLCNFDRSTSRTYVKINN